MFRKIMLFLLLLNYLMTAFSQEIRGRIIINKPTIYKNTTLDLNQGAFIITNDATLTIDNCTINGTISPDNPALMDIQNGKLIVKNSKLNATTHAISPIPSTPSIYSIINITHGNVNLIHNNFSINKIYTVGLLTTGNYPTKDFIIQNNVLKNFHGGFLLNNSTNAVLSHNVFNNVSISNILTLHGENIKITFNKIFFSGNNNVGDAIDIIDSQNTTINSNYILNGSCYSIFILRSKDIEINNNKVIGGITYGIYITPLIGVKNQFLQRWAFASTMRKTPYPSSAIKVQHNYLSQNRYGLSAKKVDGLIVSDNIFIQYFSKAADRRFWTNNDTLLKDINHLEWNNNYYKEAFTQDPSNSNSAANKLIHFPLHGGVVL